MTGPDLIRLAEELIEHGGIHRFTCCIDAAAHVFAEHERRRRAVESWEDGPHGVGMSDKAVRVNLDAVARFEAAHAAPSRPPEREEPSGRATEAQDGRGGSEGFQAPLVTCPVCRVTAAAFICSIWGCPVNGGAAHPEPGLCNPAPIMPERGERVSLRTGNALAEERGVTHASDSPVLTRAQSDFGRRLVPRHMPPVNPELTDGDGA